MKNQIFISYRRDGGEVMAHTLNDKLTARGYQVFYDIESLKSGAFDTKLYEEIEACTDFILVLPKNGLDNCRYEADWVRCEIVHALKHKKNIISVFLRDFAFPMDMPDEIYPIKHIQGVDFSTMDLFESKVDRIVDMLFSKPVYTNVRTSVGMQINKVKVYGTNGSDTDVPDDIRRFNSVNMEEYENVCFCVETAAGLGSLVEYTMVITDHEGGLVYDNKGLVSKSDSGNFCAIAWKIKEEGFPLIAPGKYRVTVAIEQSEQCIAGFEITVAVPEAHKDKKGFKLRKTVTDVECHLSYPRGARIALLYVATVFIFLKSLTSFPHGYDFEAMLIGFPMLAAAVICFFKLFKYSAKYFFKNVFITLLVLLTPPAAFVYGIALLSKAFKCKKICKKHRVIEKAIKEILK